MYSADEKSLKNSPNVLPPGTNKAYERTLTVY